METSGECFNFRGKSQLMNPSETPLSKPLPRLKGWRQGLEDNLSSLETGRNTTGQLENSSSWYLESSSSVELDEGLFSYLEQKAMVSEDYRSHEFRKSMANPINPLPKKEIDIECSGGDLYDFHSQLVAALSFLEDGLSENVALILGNVYLKVYVRNPGTQIENWQKIRENFQIEQDAIMSGMQEAFDSFQWQTPCSIIPLDVNGPTNKRTKNSIQDKIEWEVLELSMLKETYKKMVQEADETFRANQSLKNSLKLNLIDLNKQQERLDRTEVHLNRKMNDFIDKKRVFQHKVEQIKEKFSNFYSKFTSLASLVPEFETYTGITKKNILNDQEISKIQREIAALTTVLASSRSESETKDINMKISRLKTRLVCARSSNLLRSSTYTREIHSLNLETSLEEDIIPENQEIAKEVEVFKAKLQQERETVRERHEDMYEIWTRSFENNNILDVVRSHASKMYQLEDELTKKQEDLQNERIRLACKQKTLSKNRRDFKCQRRCFEQGLKEIMVESKNILECI